MQLQILIQTLQKCHSWLFYLCFNPTIPSFHLWLFFLSLCTAPCCHFPSFLLSQTFHLSTFLTSSNHTTLCLYLQLLCPLQPSASLASVQVAKVEEEIDSKRDSHVMWRGTKEDPRSSGGLSATCSIPHTTVSNNALPKTIPYLHPALQPALARHAYVRLLSTWMMGPVSSHLQQNLTPRVTGPKPLRQTGIIPEIT